MRRRHMNKKGEEKNRIFGLTVSLDECVVENGGELFNIWALISRKLLIEEEINEFTAMDGLDRGKAERYVCGFS